MPNDNAIKFGMLKCRDLVELYYGARMVASLVENGFNFGPSNSDIILQPDPRRIRYEIIVANEQVTPADFRMGTPAASGTGTDQTYSVLPGDALVVERDFLTDFDAVCLAVQFTNGSARVLISTRETFLTPIPVDEMP